MIGLALSAITSRAPGPVATVAAVIFLGLAVSQCAGKASQARRADKAEMALSRTLVDLSACRANTSRLEAAVGVQNSAVEAMRSIGEAKVAAAEKAVSAALSGRAAAEAKAKALASRPAVSCDAAVEEALEALK